MDLTDALLDSWDRQCKIVDAVATLVTEDNRKIKPSEDGWPLDKQLAHIHLVRRYWLGQLDEPLAKSIPNSFTDGWETPIPDLPEIKRLLKQSETAVRNAVQKALKTDQKKAGGYDHPVLFLQHMIWHEGWHVGLIFLALRLNGQEPTEEWEEPNVWGHWRTE
jgi:uncharacterized damage-inducible protein DinB